MIPISRVIVFTQIRDILMQMLECSENEILESSRLTADLEMESLQFVELGLLIGEYYSINVHWSEIYLYPSLREPNENILLTETLIKRLRTKKGLPYFHLQTGHNLHEAHTVEMLCKFVEWKLAQNAEKTST